MSIEDKLLQAEINLAIKAISPTVKVTLDKERNLLMDLNAMVAFEDATGKSMLNMETWKSLSAKDIRALLWACLIHEDKILTIEQVGKMIHAGNINEIQGKLNGTWGNAMPESDGSTGNPPEESRSPG